VVPLDSWVGVPGAVFFCPVADADDAVDAAADAETSLLVLLVVVEAACEPESARKLAVAGFL